MQVNLARQPGMAVILAGLIGWLLVAHARADVVTRTDAPAKPRPDLFRIHAARIARDLTRGLGEIQVACAFDVPEVPRPYLLAVEQREYRDEAVQMADFGAALGYVHTDFMQRFGTLLHAGPIEGPLAIVVFDDPWLGERVIAALRDLRSATRRRPLLPRQAPGDDGLDPFQSLGYQAALQLLDQVGARPDRWSPWLREGLAQTYAGLARERADEDTTMRFYLAPLRPALQRVLSAALRDGGRIDAHALVWGGAGQATDNPAYWQRFRAHAWALWLFLGHGQDGRHRERLHALLAAEATGKGGPQRFETLFSLSSMERWAAFDAAFSAFVRGELHLLGR